MTPRVSICVPNLNGLPFLRERFDTIFAQTLSDWELVVYDSFSDDGSWDFIERLAAGEKRMRILQGPREGPYPAWNECVRQTKADFIYIATSDDTMAPDCLEKLVAALERNKDCDLAHCPLRVIDEAGVPELRQRWPGCTALGDASTELLRQPHVRRAPYDGLLHLAGGHVYLSMTQLLIRRSLFSRIGGFPSKWGPISDFNWEMKASLVASTVHVPGTWASWRVHPGQLTASSGSHSVDKVRKTEEMIEDAVRACEPFLDSAVVAGLKSHWLEWTRELRAYCAGLRHRPGVMRRRFYQLGQVFNGTAARSQLVGYILGRPAWPRTAHDEIRSWIESVGLGPVIASDSWSLPRSS
jgi:hypothetical protein